MSEGQPEYVGIRTEVIRLGQFLKLAGVVDSGAEGKLVLADRLVVVNGEIEVRRGRQLQDGDQVSVAGSVFVVTRAD